jgi:hypothetical protein
MQVGVKLLVCGVKLFDVLSLEPLQEETIRCLYPLKNLRTSVGKQEMSRW